MYNVAERKTVLGDVEGRTIIPPMGKEGGVEVHPDSVHELMRDTNKQKKLIKYRHAKETMWATSCDYSSLK